MTIRRKIIFYILTPIIALAIVITSVLYIFTPPNLSDTTTLGFKIRSQTWSGVITVKGDVTYAPWAKLTIEPGATIKFDKLADQNLNQNEWSKWADAYIKDHNDPTGRQGYTKSHFSIYGTVQAVGTKDKPIVFTSAQAKPEYADWDQLIILKNSRLEYIKLSYSHNGVNIDGENVTLKNSIIHDSLWSCVDVFSAGVTVENNEVYHCWHQAVGTKLPGEIIVRNNNIHDSNLGINCENGAKPTITNNQLTAADINPDCGQGLGNILKEQPADVPGGTYDGRLVYPTRN